MSNYDENFTNTYNVKKGDVVYYARIVPKVNYYDVCELTVRTVTDSYFVGVDKKEKHAHLFLYSCIDKIVFQKRKDALHAAQQAELSNRLKQGD